MPVLYGGDTPDGALSETVFRDLPPRPERLRAAEALLDADDDAAAAAQRGIRRARLASLRASIVRCRRELRLAQLLGHGLGRLGVSRRELIDSPAPCYASTTAWAAALHTVRPPLDGLVWISRQFDDARALLLFGDRVHESDLDVLDGPTPLDLGPGHEAVRRIAILARITIFEH